RLRGRARPLGRALRRHGRLRQRRTARPERPDPPRRSAGADGRTLRGGGHGRGAGMMGPALARLLDELAAFGRANDARETERARRMLNITPETGQFLAILVRATGARRILEIGTSNGYSTIWLAWAADETDGHVTTI